MKIFNRRGPGTVVRSNGLAPVSAINPGLPQNIPPVIPRGQGVGTTGNVNALSVPRAVNMQVAAIAHAGMPVE